jgi:hypothetical protein
MSRVPHIFYWHAVWPAALLAATTAVGLAVIAHFGTSVQPAPCPQADPRLAAEVCRLAASVSDQWLATRAPVSDFPLVAPPPPPAPPPRPAVAVTAAPPPVVYCMSGVAHSNGRWYARLNERFYAEGERVSPGVYLERIGTNYVVLVNTQNERRVVRLFPGVR